MNPDDLHLEPDIEDTPWHRLIVSTEPIPNTRTGNWITLECGHIATAFGDLRHARDGRVLCDQCRAAADPQK